MSDAPVIVITGATGFIGAAAAAHFSAKGFTVITAGRKKLNNFENIHFDLTDEYPDGIKLPHNTQIILHAAYLTLQQNKNAFELNLNATRLLLDAAKKADVKQFIFLSSLSALPDAISVYGKQKFACENLVLQNGGCVVRPGLVIGRGGLFAAMQKHIAAGKRIPIFGKGTQPLQTVFIGDLLLAFEKIAAENRSGAYTIAVQEPIPYRRFFELIAEHCGKTANFINLPFTPVKFLLRIASWLRISLPVSSDNLAGLQTMRHINSADDLKKLGIVLKDAAESIQLISK
ncbi:MAG: NAD-dependent epimerase/dehydratase family protein [Bacteroidota bacterium]|jgi:NADH dehydrogenase